jgi:phytol kinase
MTTTSTTVTVPAISVVRALLLEQPWLATAVMMTAFLALIASLAIYKRTQSPHGETVRKLLHVGSGLLTLTFPFIFNDRWPVLLLTGLSAALIGAMKFLPPVKRRLGALVGGDDRATLGEFYFPIAVAAIFVLAKRHEPQTALLFCIPILVLTLADATGALIGIRYGLHQFTGAAKSLEGSVAFAIVAFFCIDVPLVVWSDVGRVETLLIAATLALLVMLLEGSAWNGLDNLFVPFGVYFVLRAWLPLDASALFARFLVTVALVCLMILLRRRSTLEDDALLAGVFLTYVTWAIAGWRWLVPPMIAFAGYAWMSPRTPENSRRIHDVPAVLAVWAFAVFWLTVSNAKSDARLLYPFTLVFAAHIAIFGASRLASDFPHQRVARQAAIAIAKSWLMFFAPFLLLEGLSITNALLALAASAGTAVAVTLFASTEASLRNTGLDNARWIRQAVSAGAGSIVGWAALQAIDRWAGTW